MPGENKAQPRRGGRPQRRREEKDKEFDQEIIDIARVTRVMAGGKRMSFRASVAIGDRKGRVGFAVAKGADVMMAVNKAVSRAKKRLVRFPIVEESIPYNVQSKFKAAKIMLKPAPRGTGIKAGGSVRTILQLSGIGNVVGKIQGGNNKINNSLATIMALNSLNTIKREGKKKVKEEQKNKKETK